jgi:PKD repeat protein
LSREARPATTSLISSNFVGRNVELFYVRYLPIKGLSMNAYQTYDERHVPSAMRLPWTGQGFRVGGWADRPGHDRFFPEIAVPIERVRPFPIAPGRNQAVWIDIYIPKTAPAGIYDSEALIYESGVITHRLPLELEVWDFTLPDVPSAATMLYFSAANIDDRYLGPTPSQQVSQQLRDRHFQMAHRHRIELIPDSVPVSAGQPSAEWGPRLDGGLFTQANGYDGPGAGVGNRIYSINTYGRWGPSARENRPGVVPDQATSYQITDRWMTWFDEHAPTAEPFVYLIDEWPYPEEIEQWAQWIRNNPGPGGRLRSMATIGLPTAVRQAPTVDIPVSTFGVGIRSEWEADAAAYTGSDPRRRLWLYNAHLPASGTFATEDDGTALRELSWGQWKKKIDRWFVWESTYYYDFQNLGTDPAAFRNVFREAMTFGRRMQFDAGNTGETGFNPDRSGKDYPYNNGDGVLFYPGTDRRYSSDSYGLLGPIASLRLKYWRRGIQDVDYLTLASLVDPAAVEDLVAGTDGIVKTVLWEYDAADYNDPSWVRTAISWPSQADAWESRRRRLAAIILAQPHGNTAPIAFFSASTDGLTVSADASQSSDPDGSIRSFEWSWGDGTFGSGRLAVHTYAAAGSYTVVLSVTDNAGAVSQVQSVLSVGAASPNQLPVASFTAGTDALDATVDGRASSDADGSIVSWHWLWGDGSQGTGATARHAYAVAGSYTITLTVTDDRGASAQTQRVVALTNPAAGSWRRVEDSDPSWVYSGNWTFNNSAPHSGGSARFTSAAGSRATISFVGTGVRWAAYRDPWCGIAKVYIDGLFIAEVDTYTTDYLKNVVVYSRTGLSSGSHTLVIEADGRGNASARGGQVWLDAIDVLDSPPPTGTGAVTRVEESDPAWSFTGAWAANTSAPHSGGRAMVTQQAGARGRLTFNGTGVRWIAYRDMFSGIANVYVDGMLHGRVDTYVNDYLKAVVVYEVTGLTPGAHMLTIEVLGERNPSARGVQIWIDAADVIHGS